jgi:hypothetical protein
MGIKQIIRLITILVATLLHSSLAAGQIAFNRVTHKSTSDGAYPGKRWQKAAKFSYGLTQMIREKSDKQIEYEVNN